MFTRYGVPDILVTDNGPQFASAEFVRFTQVWAFEHCTSSPRYSQLNGKAENTVKTVKRLFTKCKEAGQSEYQALLDWRNTPTEGMGTSPAQRFLGRRCKTLLPLTNAQLQPQYATADDAQTLQGQKAKQRYYYIRHARDLPAIARGDAVCMRLPGETTWTPGVYTGFCGPRSYRVQVREREFRRKRRQLILTKEHTHIELPNDEPGSAPPPADKELDTQYPADAQHEPITPPTPHSSDLVSPDPPPPPPTPPLPRRSVRARKPPDWVTTYVPL